MVAAVREGSGAGGRTGAAASAVETPRGGAVVRRPGGAGGRHGAVQGTMAAAAAAQGRCARGERGSREMEAGCIGQGAAVAEGEGPRGREIGVAAVYGVERDRGMGGVAAQGRIGERDGLEEGERGWWRYSVGKTEGVGEERSGDWEGERGGGWRSVDRWVHG